MNEQYYSPQRFSILPPVVKNLLIINGLFFLATIAFRNILHIDLYDILGLHYIESELFYPHQFITYMFMHGGFGHIFFNMFALWMFGSSIENYWGAKKMLIYYFITGIGAALVQELVCGIRIYDLVSQMHADMVELVKENGLNIMSEGKNYSDQLMGELNLLINTPTVGASGSVYGLLLAFGMIFPNALIYLYFFIPVKAKWFVIVYGAIELFYGISGSNDGVAHFAHLGGMIFGILLILLWKKKRRTNYPYY
ncbi:MAG: rhomboid family intramembrane serine protease [Bacteroidales bacterium]|jgi:membrane associated rhomboid family serine protease|nr:rhomboid family intramembrane serine protease [Bacteroidales bacterium]